MPVELRKRKPREEPAPPPPRKKTGKAAKAVSKVKEALTGKKADPEAKEEGKPAVAAAEPEAKVDGDAPLAVEDKKAPAGKVAVGDTVDLDGFGGEIETNDGKKTTLKALVDESKAGVVLFTYPKANTPGCTTQACLFRDSYAPLTADGLAIYGLSTDSPKANSTFKERQKLPYPLLCDPAATLIAAIGLKKTPKGTQRGVFVVDKAGKVLLSMPGGPAATVDAVKKLVEESKA
jgi:peroxiredoxin Q/BCP